MRTPTKSVFRISLSAAALLSFILTITNVSLAQFTPNTEPSRQQKANQLPLSGRSGQTGSVKSQQTPVAGTTNSINTLNPAVQTQGTFNGSALGAAKRPFSGTLSFGEALARGLDYNLGEVSQTQAVRQAQGQGKVVRSNLLPNINGYLSETLQQVNLNAFGLRLNQPLPNFSIPTIVGPFNLYDLRATLTQSVIDLTARNNYAAAGETTRAATLTAVDAKELVVLAVGGGYLQVVAAAARVESARAQLETANALYDQARQQREVGLLALTDVNRSQIEALTQRQRLITLDNDLSKQKINLARLTGLPPNDQYDIADDIPFSPAPAMTLNDALRLAFEQRSDLKAAEAQVRAATKSLSAARSERLPSVNVRGDYGVIGTNPAQSHGTFSLVGTLNFPIWQGGRIEGDIVQAEAVVEQRQAELEDTRGQIESDVRNAYLDLDSATRQVEVALTNIGVAQENLTLTRQRFDEGVSDNVAVVQSQEAVSTSHLDYINTVFAHNLAKLSLARATGSAADNLGRFLKLH
jgi:outer membrane protein TolC